MTIRSTFASIALLAVPVVVMAQHGGALPPPTHSPREASQFDFLVGQWELVVRPHVSGLAAKIHGAPQLAGTWKAWRGLDGWGIEDEVRITDSSGNPRTLTHCVRVYDAAARRWNVSSLDVYRSTFQPATAEWRDGEMHTTTRGTDQDGRPYVSRARFHDIRPDGFRIQQDRSYDDGRTWTEGFVRIEARRVAAIATR